MEAMKRPGAYVDKRNCRAIVIVESPGSVRKLLSGSIRSSTNLQAGVIICIRAGQRHDNIMEQE